MLNLMTVVGTRPEIIKLSRVIAEADKSFQHTLVHTGQNYDFELNEVFFRDLEIRKPDHFLGCAGETPAETVANVILKTDQLLKSVRPDAFLVYGDTNSCLSAYAAKRHKIPVFHMEAGNRCFDERVPEEINRRIVDHISDINMPLTEHGRRYLIQEGIRPETIIKTGSCIPEVLDHHRDKFETSRILDEFGLKPGKYFVLSIHREENVDSIERLCKLSDVLIHIERRFNMPMIFSMHPRTRMRIGNHGIALVESVRILPPLGYIDYISLQKSAFCVISDSGTITEEANILGFPAVTPRQAHERPEGMDNGVLVMCDFTPDQMIDSIILAASQFGDTAARRVPDYEFQLVSRTVVNAIQSYTSYIRRTVWRES